jgi:hypothetical protein
VSKKDTLDWIVPELARAKLLINELWVPAHAAVAEAMFSAQGAQNENKPFTNAAVVMAVVHPWGWQTIQQAPVLVAALPRVYGFNSIDEHNSIYSETGRMKLGKRWKTMLDAKPKLRDLMAFAGIPYALRNLTPHAAKSAVLRSENVCKALCSLGESHVAQTLPPRDHQRQRNWLFAFGQWVSGAETAACEPKHLDWLASVGAHFPYPYELRHLSDFVHQSNLFNPRWGMARAVEEMKHWHTAIGGGADGVRFRARHGRAIEEVIRHDDGLLPFIDWGSEPYLPGAQPTPHYEFHRLNSGLLLQEEAKAMHHCVAASGYVNRMIRGRSLIWSMREAVVNKRVATVELEVDAVMEERLHQEPIYRDVNPAPMTAEEMRKELTFEVNSEMRMVPRLRVTLRQAVGPCNAKLSGYAARAVNDFCRFVQENYRVDFGQGRELLDEARVRFEKQKQMLDRSTYLLEASRHLVARPDLHAQQLRRLGLIEP